MGKVFGSDGMNVEGTGQTVGDLKDAGWSKGDMDSMGLEAKPNAWQKGISGALKGGGGALQKQGGQQPRGSAVQIDVAQTPQVDASGFANPNYLTQWQQQRQQQQQPINPQAFYGGY